MITGSYRALRAVLLPAGLLAAAFASSMASAAPSTQLTVTGAVSVPKVYDATSIASLPATTQTVSFLSGTTPQTHTYTGTSLWGLLNGAGIVTDPAVKNDVLDKIVVATGTDGYRVVYSLGELDPNFGNRPDLVAYAETIGGTSAPLGPADGFARTTVPDDVRGGRYVSNLANLDVRGSGSTTTSSGGGASTGFSVSGAVLRPLSFDLAALQALPRVTQVVGTHTYVGASFWDLLNTTVGLSLDPAVKNDVLGKYVVATGSDGYKSVFSLGELSSVFGNQPDLIAYEEDGALLSSDGFARVVAPNDVRAGRWVSNLTSLEVFTAAPIPEPETYALMLAGLALVGVAARRRTAVTARRAP